MTRINNPTPGHKRKGEFSGLEKIRRSSGGNSNWGYCMLPPDNSFPEFVLAFGKNPTIMIALNSKADRYVPVAQVPDSAFSCKKQ